MAAVSQGTTCLWGIAGTVSNIFVQSYTTSSTFNVEAMVADETGLTKTWRADDRKSELTVEGIVKSGTVPVLGAVLSFTTQTLSVYPSGSASTSFSGVITKVEEKGTNKGFVSVSVTAVDYESVTMA